MNTLLVTAGLAVMVLAVYLQWKNSLLQRQVDRLQSKLARETAGGLSWLQEKRINAVMALCADRLFCVGPDGTVTDTYIRPGFHGTGPDKLRIGARLEAIFAEPVADRYQQAIEQALLTGKMQSFTYEGEHKGGTYGREVRITCCGNDVLVVERDASEYIFLSGQLRYLNSYDNLTGLLNRSQFEQEVQRLADAQVGVVVCDVDCLKLINDNLGVEQGDRVLIAVAEILRHCFRPEDCIARLVGDSFAVLAPGLDEAGLQNICRRLNEEIAEYNRLLPCARLSLAVGYAVSTPGGIETALTVADDAMHRQKLQHSDAARKLIIEGIFSAYAARDHFDSNHQLRVEEYALALAEAVGLSSQQQERLRLFARYHDIGKAGLAEPIALKPGRLTDSEWRAATRHSEIGSRIARNIPELAPIAELILKHHERWDGRGYPFGLQAEQIPLECRIMAIAEAYEVMTAGRPYAAAREPDQALAELRQNAGRQFDPRLIELFIQLMQQSNGGNRED